MIYLAVNNWKIHQMGVKSTFLNGFLEKEVYVQQPLGYILKGKEYKVMKLKKALYALKQAPRAWNSRIDKYFLDNKFTKYPYDMPFTLRSMKMRIYFLFACMWMT